MSAAGNKPAAHARRAAHGLTLLELLVVLSIMAFAVASVSWALRDPGQARLEQDAWRLAALLDSARAQSQASGNPVYWRNTAEGFRFEGLPAGALPQHWLDQHTQAAAPSLLQLGPEPIIPAQRVLLGHSQGNGPAWQISTDGLRPFTVQPLVGAAP